MMHGGEQSIKKTTDGQIPFTSFGVIDTMQVSGYHNLYDLNTIGLRRGYCGHEMLPEFGIINMNGRLYDPLLGRFLSPDKYIQAPFYSQNYNRYSYCINNPLKYTDESGNLFGLGIIRGIFESVHNFLHHGFAFKHYHYSHNLKNDFKIDFGIFKGNVGQILNKWTWGITNSVLGNVIAHGANLVGMVDNVTSMDGMLALSGITRGNAAFTLGFYSFGPDNYVADWRDNLFVHEYGHYIQSQYLGPTYLSIVGVPSLLSAAKLTTHIQHEYRWFEVSASYLGSKYFDDKYGSGADDYKEGDKNYFSLQAFTDTNYISPYINPRTNDNKQDKVFPIHGTKHSGWDFLIPISVPAMELIIGPLVGQPIGFMFPAYSLFCAF